MMAAAARAKLAATSEELLMRFALFLRTLRQVFVTIFVTVITRPVGQLTSDRFDWRHQEAR